MRARGDPGPRGRRGTMFGRLPETMRLGEALARAAGGEPGLLVLSGPLGVGKSRLGEEALRIADEAGYTSLLGYAEQLGTGIAYAPLASALGPALRALPPADRRELLRGMPQLSLVISGLGLRRPRPLGDPGLERMRIAEGFSGLFDRWASRTPVLLLIEDVHAADQGSAAVLGHLALTLETAPLLVIVTTRSDEPDSSRTDDLLAAVAAGHWWHELIDVLPLPDPSAQQLLEDVLGSRSDPELTRRALRLCGGVPLFLKAVGTELTEGNHLVRHGDRVGLDEERIPLSGDLHSRVAWRLSRLDEDERTVLELLALGGAPARDDVLQACLRPGRDVETILDHLELRMLVGRNEDGTSTLTHGIVAEVLERDLTPGRRRRRHAQLAHALAAREPEDPAIAEHLLRAGSAHRTHDAIAALRAAAGRAQQVGAIDDAVRYQRAACELSLSTDPDHADVLAELAELCALNGLREEADRTWQACLEHCLRQGDREGVARAHRERGALYAEAGSAALAEQHFADAEQALRGGGASREGAELQLARLAVAIPAGDATALENLSGRLCRIVEHLDAPDLEIRRLVVEASRSLAEDHLDRASAQNEHALARLATIEQPAPSMAVRVHEQSALIAGIRGDISALRRHCRAGLDIASGQGAASLQLLPRSRLVMADMLRGEWHLALRASTEVLVSADRFGDQQDRRRARGIHAWQLVLGGRLDDAERTLTPAREQLEVDSDVREDVGARLREPTPMCAAATELALARGQLVDAARIGAPLADLDGSWFPFRSVLPLGEALAQTAPGRAESLTRRIREHEDPLGFGSAIADLIDGMCRQTPRGTAALLAGKAGFDALDFPYLAARAALAAAARREHVPQERASELALGALDVFERLGAPRQAQQARRLLRELGVVPSRGRAPQETGSVLSPRELEVSCLVAAGRSNRQIAEDLFISPRTVTTHLDHVYRRLGLGSRAALTRYLADSGLLETPGPGTDT